MRKKIVSIKSPLSKIKVSRIILPIILGLAVVIYLIWRQFDMDAFLKIDWNVRTLFWFLLAIVLFAIRHLAYTFRLWFLAIKELSFLKCFELIFIWCFSSAVSPTNVGGSAVALFVLSQEDIKTAKTTTLVLYTVVLDTFFFLSSILFFVIVLGPSVLRPEVLTWSDLGAWGYTFIGAYLLMLSYGAFFYYGLFVNPHQLNRLVVLLTRLPIIRRWKKSLTKLAHGLEQSSHEIKSRPLNFHLTAFLATAVAWSCRFLVLICIIQGVTLILTSVGEIIPLYARLESMYLIMAFSPTPGGAGLAEIMFYGFLSDYIPKGIAIVIALMWRMIDYYFYLLAGAIVIPNWINKILRKRKKRSQELIRKPVT